jgi:sodium transport system ATP-binding protein
MTVMLRAHGLRKQFGAVTAVDGISLEIRAGEIVGFLGPNGAGKTTTLRMLAGILTPTEGEIYLRDWNTHEHPLEVRRRIGFLSGDTQLYQRLTPREVMAYFGRLNDMKESRIAERITRLVADLEMQSFADRPCKTLSSGQKQRANIARALLHEPEVLMLDEPTSALDVVSGHFIHETIKRERTAGRGILFSTHIMSEAERLCDRIYLVHEGRIADHGTLAEILARAGCDNLTDAFLRHVRPEQLSAATT